jgi:hypothetical protein|tara:strand:+ start:266 stop:445 length:180 start_codon:yes stop_codon:yes gene_type:complete
MNIEQINQLVEEFPNDEELGKAVRKVYWETKKLEQFKSPNQLPLFEDEDNRSDVILGYD